MRKNSRLFASLLSGIALFSSITPAIADDVTLRYEVPEVDGGATFHLDTTAITYTKDGLQKDVSYHIDTTAGNYYGNNTAVLAKAYKVSIADTEIVDTYDNTRKFSVTFGDDKTHNLNLTETKTSAVSDKIASTLGAAGDDTDKAGIYTGKATVTFSEVTA